MNILITGGAGFIGSAVVRLAITRGHRVVNLDALTYAASLESIEYVLDPIPNKTILGMTVMLCNGRTVFVADSNVHDMPNASQLANITQESAEVVREIFGI